MTRETNDTAEHLLDLRRANSARCAEVIRSGEPATIADIAQRAGLSRPTVKARLLDLLEAGIIAELGASAPQGAGRPASRYAFASDAGIVAGLELAKHVERLVFADLLGETLWHSERKAPALSADGRLADAAAWVAREAEALRAEAGPLVRVCVALPGVVDSAGIFIESAALHEWRGQNVAPIVQPAFDVPVEVVHDLAAAMLAERRMGAALTVDTFVVPVLWHRVSAGIMINGQVHEGPHGRAGRPYLLSRFFPVDIDDAEWPSDPEVRDLILAADAGNAEAAASVDRFADLAAEQIAMLQLVIDPEIIVLYGPLSVLGSLVSRVKERLEGLVEARIPLVVSEFGLYGTVLGSALIALDNAGEDLIGPGLSPLTLDRTRLMWAIDDQRAQAGAH